MLDYEYIDQESDQILSDLRYVRDKYHERICEVENEVDVTDSEIYRLRKRVSVPSSNTCPMWKRLESLVIHRESLKSLLCDYERQLLRFAQKEDARARELYERAFRIRKTVFEAIGIDILKTPQIPPMELLSYYLTKGLIYEGLYPMSLRIYWFIHTTGVYDISPAVNFWGFFSRDVTLDELPYIQNNLWVEQENEDEDDDDASWSDWNDDDDDDETAS